MNKSNFFLWWLYSFPGLMPGLGTSPGEENGNLLQCSCLENPMDRGAWRATIRRVTKSWTCLSTSPTQKHGLKITTNSVTSKTEIYAFILLEARSPKSKCQQGHSTPRDCRGESTGELSLSPNFWWLPAILGVPCFAPPSLQSLSSHCFSSVCVVPLWLTHKDTWHWI